MPDLAQKRPISSEIPPNNTKQPNKAMSLAQHYKAQWDIKFNLLRQGEKAYILANLQKNDAKVSEFIKTVTRAAENEYEKSLTKVEAPAKV